MTSLIIVTLFILAGLLSTIGGLLAAADAAYSVSSRTDLEELAQAYPKKAQAIRRIAEDRASHMNAVNFVRVIAETFAAVLITVALDAVFQNLWLTLLCAVLVMSFVTFVLVGASPRSIGTHHPDQTVRITATLVRSMRVLLGPIAANLIRLGDRVSPGRVSNPGRIRDEQQLLSMVDQAAEQELLEEDEQDFIHSIVEFGETVVREVMVPRTDMVTIEAAATVAQAFESLLTSRHSRIPVTSGDSDEIVGVVYLRDIAKFFYRRGTEAENTAVSRIMKPAQFVPDLQRADDLMRLMQREANHLALAVDEYGGIAGLVTLEDLIEELVGEISDEHDRDVPEIIQQNDGSYRVFARVSIEDLGGLFDLDLEDDEVETVGGLVAKHLGRLPEEGDTVVVTGIELTVLETERKKQRLVSAAARWVGAPITQSDRAADNDAERASRSADERTSNESND